MKHFSLFMEHLAARVTRYPKTTIIICLLITGLFATQLPKLRMEARVKGMFPPDYPARVDLDELETMFGGSEIVLLGIVAENLYDSETLETLQRLSEEIEDLDEVDDVTSLFTVKDIIGTDEGMDVHDLIEEIPDSHEAVQALRERLQANPLFWDNIISADETMVTIVATIVPHAVDLEVYQKFQAIIDREEKEHTAQPLRFYLGGGPIISAYNELNMQRDMNKFFPIGLLLMIGLLYLSFGSLRGIFLPFTVVVMSIFCTFGLMAWLGKPITLMGVQLPAMLIAIANDYSIHLVARYYEDIKAHLGALSRQRIVSNVMTCLGIPILLAGVTTVAGFASQLSHIMPPAKDLGLLSSFGIIMAFLFSITFVPAWLAILPVPKAILKKRRKDYLDRLLRAITSMLTRHPALPKRLCIFGVLIVVVFLMGIPRIVVDTDPINFYEQTHPLTVSTCLFNEKTGGSGTIDVVFDGDIKQPETLQKIQELQGYMDTLPQIGKTVSLVDHLKSMNKAMHADDPAYETIPETRNLVAQYLLLYSMSGEPDDFDDVVDYEYRKAHLIGRINVTGTTETRKAIQAVESYVAEHFPQTGRTVVENVTGFSVLIDRLFPLVVQGQIRSLLISLVVIFVITTLAFRSEIAGLFCIYPISVAMVMVFGLMGYCHIELNIATAMLSSTLIGVGVDYTIHFLYHYREEVRQFGKSPHEALEITLIKSGKGIIYNALSVIVGFAVLMFSAFLPVYFFGWLLTFSILACLIGALTLLPAAILLFTPQFIFKSPLDHQASGKRAMDRLKSSV